MSLHGSSSASLDLLRINSLDTECGKVFDAPTPRQLLGKWQVASGWLSIPTHSSSLSGRDQPCWVDILGHLPKTSTHREGVIIISGQWETGFYS